MELFNILNYSVVYGQFSTIYSWKLYEILYECMHVLKLLDSSKLTKYNDRTAEL